MSLFAQFLFAGWTSVFSDGLFQRHASHHSKSETRPMLNVVTEWTNSVLSLGGCARVQDLWPDMQYRKMYMEAEAGPTET